MEDIKTIDLFSELQNRLIIKTENNEIICPTCKGLRFKLVDSHIEQCRDCHTGIVYVCKHCSQHNSTNYCKCNAAYKEREEKYNREQAEKDRIAFEKAEKINYKDYSGYYLIDERLCEIDMLEEWIEESLKDGESVPEYMWAVEGEPCFSINLIDIISDKCEDGYEDMYSHLDTNSEQLVQAQALIEEWEQQQGGSLYGYGETYKRAIIIKDLVDIVKSKM